MYTGIVEALGEILAIDHHEKYRTLWVRPEFSCSGIVLGESIAINGVCLTVSADKKDSLKFDVVQETLDKTTLGSLSVGSVINIERSLLIGGRMGGHFVSGHVDHIGKIIALTKIQGSYELNIQVPIALMKFIPPKGSIAIDGMSLTIVEVGDTEFSVSLIPHTLSCTIAKFYEVGTKINIEIDLLARYLHQISIGGNHE